MNTISDRWFAGDAAMAELERANHSSGNVWFTTFMYGYAPVMACVGFLAMDSESTDVMAPWLQNIEAQCSLWKQEEEIGGKATTRRRVLTRERQRQSDRDTERVKKLRSWSENQA